MSETSRGVQLIRQLLRSETRVLFTLTAVVGCLSGLAAVGFHLSIDFLASRLLDPLLARTLLQRVVLIPLLLIAVGLFVGILLDRVVPFARGSGIPEVKAAYVFGPGAQLSLRTVVGKFVLGALSIGAGFRSGRRDRPFRFARRSARPLGQSDPAPWGQALISVGLPLGLRPPSSTPIAAITFAMERVISDLNRRLIGAIVVASVAAAVVERLLEPAIFAGPGVPGRLAGAFRVCATRMLAGLGATVFVRSCWRFARRAAVLLIRGGPGPQSAGR